MTKERRYFLCVQGPLGVTFQIGYGYPEFVFSVFREGQKRIIYKREIPREFWGLSLRDYENYFERGIKPRIRVGGAKDDERG